MIMHQAVETAADADSVETLLARGLAPVKRSYLRALQPGTAGDMAQSVSAEGAPTQPKSRRQMKRERRAQSKLNLCNSFMAGSCTYGDKCKFSHQVDAYLEAKHADLPGQCPFADAPVCPYGIACRWAGTHGKAEEAKPLAESSGGTDSQALMPTFWPLPPMGAPQAPHNALGKSLQTALWHNSYDFSRTSSVLQALGIVDTGGSGVASGRHAKRRRLNNPAGSLTVVADPPADEQASLQAQVVGKGVTLQQCEGGVDPDQQSNATEPNPLAPASGTTPATFVSGGHPDGSECMQVPSVHASPDVQHPSHGLASVHDRLGHQQDTGGSAADGSAGQALPLPNQLEVLSEVLPDQSEVPSGQSEVPSGQSEVPSEVLAERRAAYVEGAVRSAEVRTIDLRARCYLAPLTTVGNLPFRRVCKWLGCDVTCGEMAMPGNLLAAQASEWALLKRDPSEDCFGVQLCAGHPAQVARAAQLIADTCNVDFVDVNFGCPTDLVCERGGGAALLLRPARVEAVARAAAGALGATPLTLKMRMGYYDNQNVAHALIADASRWGARAVTLHGRSRQQRYTRAADWDYISHVGAELAASGCELQLVGNGDVLSWQEWHQHVADGRHGVATAMIARGALIKPWIFTEVKERRDWDISASERFDLLARFVGCGLTHWGSDERGVENTRRFLLEWLSFTWRYIPVGLLEVLPQRMSWRPPALCGRSDLETLLASDKPADWLRISSMLLGPPPPRFTFTPKHKSNAYPALVAPGGAPAAGLNTAVTDVEPSNG